jgi:NADPH:quinone reductase-like Zn-dependent oxidoreductase
MSGQDKGSKSMEKQKSNGTDGTADSAAGAATAGGTVATTAAAPTATLPADLADMNAADIRPMFGLEGKVILVTGGNRGIGKQIVILLEELGA